MNHLLSAVKIEAARCKEMDAQSALAVRGAIRNLARNLYTEGNITAIEYAAIVDELQNAYPEEAK